MISIDRYKKILKRIAEEKGDINFFALMLRDDAHDKWELAIAAPWAEPDRYSAIRYIAGILKAELQTQEILQLSRIVVLEKDSPVLAELLSSLAFKDHAGGLHDWTAGGHRFRHVYILEARCAVAERAQAGYA
jgi:hypothetical protein